MAKASLHHQKWEDIKSEQQDEEDEALSLSDLPINLIDKDVQPSEEDHKANEAVEEFDFGSLAVSLRTESEMCAADEVFFQGQILPYRHSLSSECNSTGLKHDIKCPKRSLSRSGSVGGFTSSATSSRSSSIRSHQSSSSSSNSSSLTRTQYRPKPRSHNQFLTHPSPKPQIKSSNYLHSLGSRNHKSSSVWEFFRLNLVRAPDIELQDLKSRTRSNNNNNASKGNSLGTKKDMKPRFLERTMLGCKCSVETIPLNVAVDNNETAMHALGDKLKELKIKQKKQKRQEMSRLRTFEWLKELSSHAEQRVEGPRLGS